MQAKVLILLKVIEVKNAWFAIIGSLIIDSISRFYMQWLPWFDNVKC